MAEFAVAFNLAFGEFKQEKSAELLSKKFESLDRDFEDILVSVINDRSDRLQSTNWLGRSVIRLDTLRKFRQNKANALAPYRPMKEFLNRWLLFSTNPNEFERLHDSYLLKRWSFIKGSVRGGLSSWAYSKTKNWVYAPCREAVLFWALVVIASLVLVLGTQENGTLSVFGSQLKIPYFPNIFIFLGAFSAPFFPRPLSILAGKFLGRYPPTPRGRYYSIIMIFLVSFVLCLITLLETEMLLIEFMAPQALWFFLFGFLGMSMLFPIILISGYLALEDAISNWTNWIESYAKERVDATTAELLESTREH